MAVLPAFGLALLSWELWPQFDNRPWPIIFLATVMLAKALGKIQANRSSNLELEQFRMFLEYLSARLAAGETLSAALTNAAPRLASQLGQQSQFFRCLDRLRASLEAQVSLERSLDLFQADFNHPKARSFVRVLPFLDHFGGRIDVYVRQSHRSLNAEISTQKEIQAEQSAKNSEAFILLFLPFIMAAVIGRGSYGQSLKSLAYANQALNFLYLLAVFAASISLALIARQNPYRRRKLKAPKLKRYALKNSDYRRADLLLSLLPWGLGLNLAASVRFVYSEESTDPWPNYCRQKLHYALISLALGLSLTFLLSIHFLILIPLLPLAQDLRLWEAKKVKNESYRLEYPDFLNLMSILLKSGLSLDKAIALQAESLSDDQSTYSILERDLLLLNRRIQNSVPAEQALAELSRHLPSREISAALALIVRYARDGGKELLDILELQANACWQVYRNAMRAKLERQNLALVIPMGLDLLVILATSILPAIASFSNITI
ncbi:MAG: type II secretion system F family protein [Eubacteriales bacterium]|nr:type II secretion system F family protein [Eubacteriales bacterium]